MNPESLPLKDIHLPADVPWWPLAPGWWVLLAALLVLTLLIHWLAVWRRGVSRRVSTAALCRAARDELHIIARQGGVEAALQVAADHALAYAAAVRAGHFQPKPPSGGCPSNCPAAAFCWRCHWGSPCW